MKPKLVDKFLSDSLIDAIAGVSIYETYQKLIDNGWNVYVVSQRRGYCHMLFKIITIPAWVTKHEDQGYWLYYVAHEFAHALGDIGDNHNQRFMERFMKLCPVSLQHYETEYKPRNAANAGISKVQQGSHKIQPLLDVMDILGF